MNCLQTKIWLRIYLFTLARATSLMKEDKNGPKNWEIILGLGYSNSVDPDQMPRNGVSNQCLHSFSLIL